MFCTKCGNKLEEGSTFCVKCGTKLEGEKTPVAEARTVKKEKDKNQKDNVNKKNKIVGTVAVLALVAVVVGLVFLVKGLFGGSDSKSTYDELVLYKKRIIYNDTVVEDCDSRGLISVSLAGNCYITNDGYCIAGGKAYEIEDLFGYAAVAASGAGVVYCTEDGGVELLNTDNGRVTVIEKKGDFYNVAISPDGQTVLYADGKNAYVFNKGKSKEIFEAKNNSVVNVDAVANDAKYIFVNVFDQGYNTLYCLDKDGEKIEKFEDVSNNRFTNNANTQIGFAKMKEDRTYEFIIYDASENDDTKIKVAGFDILGKMPVPVAPYYETYIGDHLLFGGIGGDENNIIRSFVTNYGVDTLFEGYYCGDSSVDRGLYYIDNNKMKMVAERILGAEICSDGSIVYIDTSENENKLCIYKDGDKETIKKGRFGGFVVACDGKTIYYLTGDKELYCYKDGDSEKIAKNIATTMGAGFCVVGSDIVMYRDTNSDLYMYNDGEVEEVDSDIEYAYPGVVNQGFVYGYLGNRTIKYMTGTGRFGNRTNFMPYIEDGDLYILYSDGKTKCIMKDFE